MQAGSLILSNAALRGLLDNSISLLNKPISAVLLAPGYEPDKSHSSYSDISAYLVRSADYKPTQLTGCRIEATASFSSDPLNFGGSVTISPVRYVAFVSGLVKTLNPNNPLIGVAALANGGTAIEAIRSSFSISPPDEGWFSLTQP